MSSQITAILVLLCLVLVLSISPIFTQATDAEELSEFEELLAIDEELEHTGEVPSHTGKLSEEVGVLRKAQKIVVELSNENAKRVVDGNEYVMLLGYTPWCERSAELMPRFAEASMILREMGSDVVMAKLDCERYTKAAGSFGIKGFPTVMLFVNGTSQPQLYHGGFTTEEIVTWVRKKTGFPIVRIHSVTEATSFLAKHQEFVIGLFESYEVPEYTEFKKAAVHENEFQFVETNKIDIAEVLFPGINQKNNFIGLVKSEPEKFVMFDGIFEEENILKFVNYNKFPLVTTMTEQNSARVYSSPIKLQVFVIAESDDLKRLISLFQDIARKYKTKIMIICVDAAEDNLAKPFLTLFGIKADKPKMVAFNGNVGMKYLLESDLTADNIDEFCNGLLHGTQKQHFKSEPIPENKEIVAKVVGQTFDSFVLDSSENVFLEVYTPWCMDCLEATKKVQKLAKHFKGRSNLVFGRIDFSANEHPELKITAFPTLLFYPSGAKSDPIKVSKKSSLKDMIAFVESRLKLTEDTSPEEQNGKDEL